jgi:hypothetical protein
VSEKIAGSESIAPLAGGVDIGGTLIKVSFLKV